MDHLGLRNFHFAYFIDIGYVMLCYVICPLGEDIISYTTFHIHIEWMYPFKHTKLYWHFTVEILRCNFIYPIDEVMLLNGFSP